ncbi:IQ motif and ankyrin repeat domain-containing protein 1-like [Ptychodera flava]|uniref:IQ motif and ankyrin repeat domain-containing protein 1-like n=1 Tax=Ptychodera flava TaxID=63121 RepID=UPI00396A1C0D
MPPKKSPAAKPAAKPAGKPAAKSTVKPGGKSTTKAPAKQSAKAESSGAAAAVKVEPVGVSIGIKQLNNVLKDEDGKMKATGRWPLVIDKSGRAATFLRYQYANYLTAVNPGDLQPETLRKALIGAIRYGKELTIDMVESDLYENLETQLETVQKGLLESIVSKEILKDDKYLSLVKDEDGSEYGEYNFNPMMLDNFMFIIVTEKEEQEDRVLQKFYTVKILE